MAGKPMYLTRYKNTSAVVISILALLATGTPIVSQAASESAKKAERLFVVDCLLPGQIRQLGKNRSYLSARRPVKTTASDCEIRGGEYVSYDRASYSTALKVWLPLAKQGDTEARVNVGEIYEKGLGLAPDYKAAAYWYRLAADEGNTRAQINLAHLYEKGLGVDENPVEAMAWYRKASGLETKIDLDPGTVTVVTELQPDPVQTQKLDALHRQVEQLMSESRQLREHLQRTQKELGESHEALNVIEGQTNERLADPDPDTLEELRKLRTEVVRHDNQSATFQRMLKRTRLQLAEAEQSLEGNNRKIELQQQELARESAEDQQKLTGLRHQLKQREIELSRQQAEMANLKKTARQLESESSQYQSKLSEQEGYKRAVQERALAGPTLTLVDPQISVTRGPATVSVHAGIKIRNIVGRAEAPAGILSLSVNDRNEAPNELGVFSAAIKIKGTETPVSIVAIDNQGKRSVFDFTLKSEADTNQQRSLSSAVSVEAPKLPPVDFGDYYALVIGNNDYAHWPKLETAVNDADDVAKVLQEKYGFNTIKLTNATRYETLSALNELREKLTKDDNLLVYYAGHGELDRVNMRGHWIPVDADVDNTANWLSNIAITDILNVINAGEVMLVVDSCYSGALTRSALSQIKTGKTREEYINWLKIMTTKRSRTVLTSGGLEPVLDDGGGDHSVFAKAFLSVLESNQEVLEGQRLYRDVAAQVAYAASNMRFEQVPEYAPIKYSGHEGGDFFLVPKN